MTNLNTYLPAKPVAFALTSEQSVKTHRAFRPITIAQIFGGRTWSIALIRVKPLQTGDFE